MSLRVLLLKAFAVTVGLSASAQAEVPDRVDYNFHVKPILSDRCYPCHGPDQRRRQADLRLDIKDGLYAALDSDDGLHVVTPGDLGQPVRGGALAPGGRGLHVVTPGDLGHSEMYVRISSDDEDVRMPPADAKLSLTAEEIAIVRRWIEQGAQWKPHWSLIPPPFRRYSTRSGPGTKSTTLCSCGWSAKDSRPPPRPAASE